MEERMGKNREHGLKGEEGAEKNANRGNKLKKGGMKS